VKRLLFSLITIGLLSTIVGAQNLKKGSLIESKDEKGVKLGAAMFSGWMTNADCKNITEGMDLKIVKAKAFDKTYAGYTKGVLVKLPTGMTTWVILKGNRVS